LKKNKGGLWSPLFLLNIRAMLHRIPVFEGFQIDFLASFIPMHQGNLRLFVILLIHTMFHMGELAAQRHIELGAFVAIPVGNFGSTEFPEGAFAKTGWGIAVSSRIPTPNVYERFSIYLHGSWQNNRINHQAVGQAFTERLGFDTEVSESRYSPVTATIGPSHHLIKGRVDLFLNAGIGVLFNNTRAFSVKVYDMNGSLWINEVVSFVNNPAWAYLLGFDLSTDIISDRLRISLFADYIAANQEVDIYLSTETNAGAFEELRFLNAGLKLALNLSP
jgi:hypothetical protein